MLIYTYKEQVCIKKDHEKFKILDILAVTTQAREGIETGTATDSVEQKLVTTQAREGIETAIAYDTLNGVKVTTQAREGIETHSCEYQSR
ncbi:hypothetical protein OCV46_14870 [Anthropogastromicrobium aceti]|uniref:hypothetical protein n=1 Tax=Anthropogastromicrobium aceti TaxID=2981768 RepID=UPI0008206E0B|nr:hypothetical protein [Anthropogastromicrobium aceti]MCU6785190.1 hypothetical protein [Anthropogastromicrobium aceti]SCJ84040.1 Uncharacterised protein [uncultured Lachnospira sp.]